MTRIVARPRRCRAHATPGHRRWASSSVSPRSTRNEAIWLAAGLVIALAWRAGAAVRLVVAAGVIAFARLPPWAIRDWLVFGSPLPGQAVANALSA